MTHAIRNPQRRLRTLNLFIWNYKGTYPFILFPMLCPYLYNWHVSRSNSERSVLFGLYLRGQGLSTQHTYQSGGQSVFTQHVFWLRGQSISRQHNLLEMMFLLGIL